MVIDWSQDLSAISDIGEILLERNIWLEKKLDLPIADGWNSNGDQEVIPLRKQKLEGLTFYDSLRHEAYLTLVLGPNDSFDVEKMLSAKSWVENKKHPDDFPVLAVNVIFPDRSSAIKFLKVAPKYRVQKMLYADSERRLWNPFPEGNWI